MTVKAFPIPKDAIADFCRRHHIRKLSLFGSVLRDDFRPDSDIDVLVEFEPGHAVGWDIIDIEEELSQLFGGGHRVDIVSEKYLNRRLRARILASAEVQYAEG
jgi:predicted nucleotidyltransferase